MSMRVFVATTLVDPSIAHLVHGINIYTICMETKDAVIGEIAKGEERKKVAVFWWG